MFGYVGRVAICWVAAYTRGSSPVLLLIIPRYIRGHWRRTN